MKIKHSTKYLSLLLILFAGSGCSPLTQSNFTDEQTYNPAVPDKIYTNNPGTIAEPEETLEEELAALEKTGEWQEGKPLPENTLVNQDNSISPDLKKNPPAYDFPVTYNKQVDFYLNLFQNKQRSYFERWLARSSKYVPYLRNEFKKAGLPQDLAYLAMIESGFNPSAYSRAHAAGLWQFIKSTGKHYNLRIDSWVDERREPIHATKAAINYLSFLHKEFGDWYLAVAAYNAGEGKMSRAIRKYKTRDFWKLAKHRYLKLETKRYVPKLIAAIIISKNPEKYGFTNIQYQDPVQYDKITVPALTSLVAIAMTCNSDLKTIQKLNNSLRKNLTPPKPASFTLNIPLGTHDQVAANLPLVHPVVTTGYKTHVVKSGDTVSSICRKYKLNKTTLLKANNLHSAKLQSGKRIRIPFKTTRYVLLKKGETPESHFASASNGGQLLLHSISQGETLSKIATLYQVSPEIIMQWNGLENIHKIRAGQQLALYIDSKETHANNRNKDIATIAIQKTPSLNPENNKNRPQKQQLNTQKSDITYYRVRSGDSLWYIARKFKVSTVQIKRWNNLHSNTIRPGKRLIVKQG